MNDQFFISGWAVLALIVYGVIVGGGGSAFIFGALKFKRKIEAKKKVQDEMPHEDDWI